jgi:membrane protease YdiL (CAAX protease family)
VQSLRSESYASPRGFCLSVLNLAITTAIFAVVFLGEEIGWRGYLLFRLAEVTSGRRAARPRRWGASRHPETGWLCVQM